MGHWKQYGLELFDVEAITSDELFLVQYIAQG